MKKTIAIIFTCALLFAALSICAFADVMWEPTQDNDFYYENFDQMEYENRMYYANDKSGYLEFFSEPGGDSIGYMKNGEEFYLGYIYDDGDELWGLASYAVGEDGYFINADTFEANTAYIKMSGTTVVYDSAEFIKDNGPFDQLDVDLSELIATPGILFWTYPGSGKLVTGEEGMDLDENFSVSYGYTDVDGKTWGYVEYYYGIRDSWVCLSDPTNANLPIHSAQRVDFYPTPSSPQESSGGFSSTTLAVILVCVVVAVSLGLILTLGRKRDPMDY
jgi:hypothetical protein